MTPKRPAILIVDDVPANLVALDRLLSPMGADVVKAGSGNEALALCLDRDFALVLLDVDMPAMDGYEVAELLRGEDRTARLPIIFVTAAYRDEGHLLRGYGAGAVDYIEKPVNDFVLRSKVQVFLDLYVSRQRLEEELAQSECMRAQLRESEARFRHAVIDAPIPILLHAENGEILLTSRKLNELTGYGPADIPTTESWVAKAFGDRADEVRARLPKLYGLDSAQAEGEIEVQAADGGRLIWDFHTGPLPALPDGRRVLISMALDVTESSRVHSDLERSARDLVRSNHDLETFAYVASHDLREPLRMVNMFLGLLERKLGASLDDEGHEFIAFAKDGATRMDRLVLDLLEYSRIGRLDRPTQTIDMDEVVTSAINNLAAAISETGAEVVIPTPLPAICGNPGEIRQLFQNLLGNAIKYHRAHENPRIVLTCCADDGLLRFCVADNGIGIASQYFDRIFEIFQRLHTRAEYEGTGIGLAVCKKTVERYGGRIWVEAEEGVGSKFFFTLPGA
jgi:PAS domain S-box-containing protein